MLRFLLVFWMIAQAIYGYLSGFVEAYEFFRVVWAILAAVWRFLNLWLSRKK